MKSITLFFMLTLLAGCSTMPWDPVAHKVSLESISSIHAEISEINIYAEGEGIAIYGELSPHSVTEDIPRGHVNIKIIARDGTATFKTSIDLHRIGKLFKRPQRYSFTAAIPITPPEGSTILVSFEDDP